MAPIGIAVDEARARPTRTRVALSPRRRECRFRGRLGTLAGRRTRNGPEDWVVHIEADVDLLLKRLRSRDWEVAVSAAVELKVHRGDRVTRALAEALDAHDTAITDAAAESLIARADWLAVDLMWTALTSLEDDAEAEKRDLGAVGEQARPPIRGHSSG